MPRLNLFNLLFLLSLSSDALGQLELHEKNLDSQCRTLPTEVIINAETGVYTVQPLPSAAFETLTASINACNALLHTIKNSNSERRPDLYFYLARNYFFLQLLEESKQILQLGYHHGSVMATTALAWLYKRGGLNYLERDLLKAAMLYDSAAKRGDPVAQFELAELYSRNEFKTNNSHDQAFKLLSDAAEQGHALAQWKLSQRYLYGQGVSRDRNKALNYLFSAAEQGVGIAQRDLLSLGIKPDELDARGLKIDLDAIAGHDTLYRDLKKWSARPLVRASGQQ